jgi:phage gp29-like protein
MNGQGWQLLGEIRREVRSTIFTLVLGANLTTSADEGGSYALAEIQENSTETLVQTDRESMEETLTDDLVGCVWWMNYANMKELGIANEKPRFTIVQEKRQDPQERANVASTLNGMGVELALDDVLEQTGFRRPKDGEPVIAGGVATANPIPGFDFSQK